jgi:hypothetical protein
VGDRDGAEEQRHFRVQGAEADRQFPMLDRLAVPPGEGEAAAQVRMGGGGVRIEIDRPPERRDRFLGPPLHHGPVAERDMAPRIAVVQRDGATRVLAARPQPLDARDPPHVRAEHQAESQ